MTDEWKKPERVLADLRTARRAFESYAVRAARDGCHVSGPREHLSFYYDESATTDYLRAMHAAMVTTGTTDVREAEVALERMCVSAPAMRAEALLGAILAELRSAGAGRSDASARNPVAAGNPPSRPDAGNTP